MVLGSGFDKIALSTMPLSKIMTAATIHLLVPLLGVATFLLLCRKMSRAQIPSPPYFAFLVLLATFGGWLLVLLTTLFWEWSGMAIIGVFSLLLIAPVATMILAFGLHEQQALSRFHQGAFVASVAYSTLMFAVVLGWLTVRICNSCSHYLQMH